MGLDFSELLIQWKEPSSFQKNKRYFYLFVSIGTSIVVFLMLAIIFLPKVPNKNDPGPVILGVLPVAFLSGILLGFFMRGQVVMRENGIGRASGRSGGYTSYDEIESCHVRLETYPSAKFFTLEFKVKDPDKFRVVGPVTEITLPKEINLSSVLDLLRNKGVNVIEEPCK